MRCWLGFHLRWLSLSTDDGGIFLGAIYGFRSFSYSGRAFGVWDEALPRRQYEISNLPNKRFADRDFDAV